MESDMAAVRRRETGKLDKRRRISEAARAAFTELGFKRASMREIAERAGVATGTLFLYAPNKRSLLLWVVNDDLERLTDETFNADAVNARAHEDLLDQLISIFEIRYRYWGANPELSLNAIQELATRSPAGPAPAAHLPNYYRRQFVLQEHVAELVRAQQGRGRVQATEDPNTVAQLIMAIYNAAIRSWLRGDDPDIARAIAELRGLLRLAIDGCAGSIGRSAGGTSN